MEIFKQVLVFYIVVINIVGFLVMAIDKSKARKHRRRISERTLFLIAIIMGSVGTLAGMYTFHHKTRHLKFVAGIPVILAAQVIIGIIINMKIS